MRNISIIRELFSTAWRVATNCALPYNECRPKAEAILEPGAIHIDVTNSPMYWREGRWSPYSTDPVVTFETPAVTASLANLLAGRASNTSPDKPSHVILQSKQEVARELARDCHTRKRRTPEVYHPDSFYVMLALFEVHQELRGKSRSHAYPRLMGTSRISRHGALLPPAGPKVHRPSRKR